MKANNCYHDAPHKIWNSYIVSDQVIPVTSCDIVFLRLALFSFVLLFYLFCDICSDMFKCLFCILFNSFSNNQNYENRID